MIKPKLFQELERYFKYDVPNIVQSCTVVDCESD